LRLRSHDDVLLFFEKEFGVGAHIGLEFATGIGNRDANFESGDVIFFFSEREILVTCRKFLVLEGFDDDARRLIQITCRFGFVDFALT